MKAIEILSKTDKSGQLKIACNLGHSERKVRVLLLIEDEMSGQEDENLWMKAVSNNPSFDYLNDPAENIYSLKDGEPFND
jgi:hypothetical protein